MKTILGLEQAAPYPMDAMAVSDARALWAEHRACYGFKPLAPPMLTPPGANRKLARAQAHGRRPTFGLTLAPAKLSGVNVCPWSGACVAICVINRGNARYTSVQLARIARTRFLLEQPHAAFVLMADELQRATARLGPVLFRFNTGSDARPEILAPWLGDGTIKGLAGYDYTKRPASQRRNLGPYYRVIYSLGEGAASMREARRELANGGTVAIVLRLKRTEPMPTHWHGIPIVEDADIHDDRYNSPPGLIGLRAKGRAYYDATGFVHDPD